MTLSEEQIGRLQKSKDEDVKALLDFYLMVKINPAFDSYIARVNTLRAWNDDLTKQRVSIITSSKKEEEQGRVDKETDRVLKYLEKQPELVKGTEELWKKLSPEEKEEVTNRDKRIIEGEDRPFKAKVGSTN